MAGSAVGVVGLWLAALSGASDSLLLVGAVFALVADVIAAVAVFRMVKRRFAVPSPHAL